jgi:predicted membrane GTPase involved in stress response
MSHAQVVVVVNKIDRPAARPEWVVDSTFELFMDLGASDEQCEFPVVYASGVQGIAGNSPDAMAEDLQPLFEAIVKEVAPPQVAPAAPLQLLVTNIDYDEHKGRIAIGRVTAGGPEVAAGGLLVVSMGCVGYTASACEWTDEANQLSSSRDSSPVHSYWRAAACRQAYQCCRMLKRP